MYDRDTVINSITCKILKKSSEGYYLNQGTGITYRPKTVFGNELVYENNGVVYLFYQNSFDTLFNFNANIGDSWRMAKHSSVSSCSDSSSSITVIDTAHKVINAVTLKCLIVELNYGINWNKTIDTICERIGFLSSYMFPLDHCGSALDAGEGGGLRCYQDNAFSLYKSPTHLEDCDFTLGVDDFKNERMVSILLPNPTSGIFSISTEKPLEKTSIFIYDVSGNIVFQKSYPSFEITNINISNCSDGLYFVELHSSGKTSKSKMVLKKQP